MRLRNAFAGLTLLLTSCNYSPINNHETLSKIEITSTRKTENKQDPNVQYFEWMSGAFQTAYSRGDVSIAKEALDEMKKTYPILNKEYQNEVERRIDGYEKSLKGLN